MPTRISIIKFFDRIYRIDGILFAFGGMLLAELIFILTIRLVLSNCFSKIRIYSPSSSINLAAFQANSGTET